ncbi:HIV Tat-specific factor 1 [Podochytrium sp. JEL0797]|nr:HIV Tat-specific factor 1 [Podochytrium sp. JEL0797]
MNILLQRNTNGTVTGSTAVFLSTRANDLPGTIFITGLRANEINTAKHHIEQVASFRLATNSKNSEKFHVVVGGAGPGDLAVFDVPDAMCPRLTMASSVPNPAKIQMWVSVDFHNGILKFGAGEPKHSNTLASFTPPPGMGLSRYSAINMELVDFCDAKANLKTMPEAVGNVDWASKITGISQNSVRNSALFPHMEPLVSLATTAINGFDSTLIDLIRQGLLPSGVLTRKMASEKRGYVRVPLAYSSGNAPGQRVVLEIWPAGNQSSVHCHGWAIAVIKVLHGTVTTEIFDPLFQANMTPVATETCVQGDVTWLTPFLNQTHRLKNTTSDVAITIQCYHHAPDFAPPLDVFHYDSIGVMNEFVPVADFDGVSGLRAALEADHVPMGAGVGASGNQRGAPLAATSRGNARVPVNESVCKRPGCFNPKMDGKSFCSGVCERSLVE